MKKVGILGGGQLGRMLMQAAADYPVETYILENDPTCPAGHLCHHFVKGDIKSFDDVYNFGKELDALTIEIEAVNIDALEALEKKGIKVYPKPAALRILANKIFQKNYYAAHQIPTSNFVITDSIEELQKHKSFFPAVHKLAMGGYDGRGVQVISGTDDIQFGFDAPAVLEKKIQIKHEISMIIAVNTKGEMVFFPPVDMVFDPLLNLLSHQVSPANISEKILWKAEAISLNAVKQLNSPGIFAVEMFADADDNVLVNEIAPRVHNSGHHTIEANYCSQFDMVWRILLDYPLGNTDPIMPSALVNIVGEPGHSGIAVYTGLEEVLAMENVFVHIYGKRETRPGRKMGHVNIISNEKQELIHKVTQIKRRLKVVSTALN